MKRFLPHLLAVAFFLLPCIPASAQYVFKAGTTSQDINLFIIDTSQSGTLSGSGLSTLAYNTSGLTAYYRRDGGGSTSITLATLSNATTSFNSGGLIATDSTNMPGHYRLDVPDAAIAAGAKFVSIELQGAANMAPVVSLIKLTGVDDQDATRGGLAALPNANANSAGGLALQSGAGSLQLNGVGFTAIASVGNTDKVGGASLGAAGGPMQQKDAGSLGITGSKLTGLVLADTLTTYTGNTPQTGDGYSIVNDSGFGNAHLVRSTTPANTLTVDASHQITFNNTSIATVGNTNQIGGFTLTQNSGILSVNATSWAGTGINAASIPVATAAGAQGGLVQLGANAGTITLNNLGIATLTATNVGLGTSTAAAGGAWFNGTLLTVTNAGTLSHLDWSGIFSATSTINLSNTTVGTVTNVGAISSVTSVGTVSHMDWNGVFNQSATVNLSNTTINAVTASGGALTTTQAQELDAIYHRAAP